MENSLDQKTNKQLTETEEKKMKDLKILTTILFVGALFLGYIISPLGNIFENFELNKLSNVHLADFLGIFLYWMIFSIPFIVVVLVIHATARNSIIKRK